MQKKVVIAGGSGLIGSELCSLLSEKGYKPVVLSRRPSAKAHWPEFKWDPEKSYVDAESLMNAYAVINLAGANISEKRWTAKRKELLRNSRIQSTRTLVAAIQQMTQKPAVFISASGSGYYGDRGELMLDENTDRGEGFLPELCEEWEKAALPVQTRLVIFRIGIVLSGKGGFLKEVAAPVKWGIGAVLGKGSQFVPWIHVEDLCRAFIHAIEHDTCEGIYNGSAPNPVSNKDITRQIAKYLHRPLLLPAVPAFFLKIFFGELTDALLMSNRCSATRLQQSGFRFLFHNSEDALYDLLRKT